MDMPLLKMTKEIRARLMINIISRSLFHSLPKSLKRMDSASLRAVIGIQYGMVGGFIKTLNWEHVVLIEKEIGLAILT